MRTPSSIYLGRHFRNFKRGVRTSEGFLEKVPWYPGPQRHGCVCGGHCRGDGKGTHFPPAGHHPASQLYGL